MTRNRQWIFLTLVLMLLGGLIFAYKIVRLGFPAWPDETTDQWLIQVKLDVRPVDGPVRLSLMLPARSSGFLVSEENFISRGFGLTVEEDTLSSDRDNADVDTSERTDSQQRTLMVP